MYSAGNMGQTCDCSTDIMLSKLSDAAVYMIEEAVPCKWWPEKMTNQSLASFISVA